MTIPTDVVAWMFFAVVALAALAIVTNYFVVKLVLHGRAALFERKGEHEHGRVLRYEVERNG